MYKAKEKWRATFIPLTSTTFSARSSSSLAIAQREMKRIPSPASTADLIASLESSSIRFLRDFSAMPAFSKAPSTTRREPAPGSRIRKNVRPQVDRGTGFEIRRRNQDQLVLHEGLGADTPVSCRTFDEAEGNLVPEEQLNNLVGIATMQRELDARILDQESCDESRKDLLGDCRGNP